MTRRKPDSYETLEEAIAALQAQLEPGAELWLHHEDCGLDAASGEHSCTCIPRLIRREVARA